jgi:hypothetical protein
VGVGEHVDLAEEAGAVDGVRDRGRVVAEDPAVVAHEGVDDGDRDRLLEALEVAHQQDAVGPRARPRDVEVITAGLGRELGGAVGGDAAAEFGVRALEGAVLARLVPVGRPLAVA